MKTKILIVLVTGILCLLACEKHLTEPIRELDRTEKSAVFEKGTLVSLLLHSNALEGNLLGDPADRKVLVYLPKSYNTDPEKRFPVIYFLHGMPAWEQMLMVPAPFEIFRQVANLQYMVDFPAEGLEVWLNELVESKKMKEAILVFPDSRTMFGVPAYTNSVVQGNYEDYICNEVVGFIDRNFRTIDHFNWRAITGHCAGAYGALKFSMRHPDVFRYVAALSPAHFPEPTILALGSFMLLEDAMWEPMGAPAGPLPYDPMQAFKFANNSLYGLAQAWSPNPAMPFGAELPFTYVDGVPVPDAAVMDKINRHNLLALTGSHKKELHRLKLIYFDCGKQDELMMYQPNMFLHQKMNAMHIKHRFETYEGGHISHLYQRLEKALVMLSNEFPEAIR